MVKISSLLKKVLLYFLVILIVLIIIFPIYWVFISSLKPALELMTTFGFFPRVITWENYRKIIFETPLVNFVINSLSIALLAAFLSTVFSSLAAFSVVRFNYKGKDLFIIMVVTFYMFQGFFLVLPLTQIMAALHLFNTPYGLALLHCTMSLPFCINVLRSFFATVPKDIEESALVDGCTKLSAFFRVTLPLSKPGIVTAFFWAFLISWNEYTFAYVMIAGETYRTVPLFLAQTIAHYAVDWGALLSGSILVTIPGLIIFFIAGKHIQKGLIAGAVKG